MTQGKDNQPKRVTVEPDAGRPRDPYAEIEAAVRHASESRTAKLLSVRFLRPITLGKLKPFEFVDLRDGSHTIAIRGKRVLVSMAGEGNEWADVPVSECVFRWQVDAKDAAEAARSVWP